MAVTFLDSSDVELINTNASDDMVAMAAWVSFDADKQERLNDRLGVGKLIDFLWRNRHTSPFEHGSFTFKVHTPIFVTREIQRHRAASYNEMSGRYTEMLPEFYIPNPDRPLVQTGKPGHYTFEQGTNDQYAITRMLTENVCQTAWNAYEDMLDVGVAKEVARNVLPLNTYTNFYMTMNPRNVMHFLGLRTADNALDEIRNVAEQVERYLEQTMPLTYKAYDRNR